MDFNALDHQYFMREALREAEQAGLAGESPIGAVIVHNGIIVGRGRARHEERHSEIAHAELNALLEAEKHIHDHIHDGIVLYTTVEPCVMCLGAVVMSDVDHIVFGLYDGNIHPEQMLTIPYVRRHIRDYLGGVLAAESLELFRRFRREGIRFFSTSVSH
ncbi:MAG: nucleoside deaminase [Anaerolineales bacterium]|nr:nucleoside deaminase [Anaerolineales bacterium]